MKPMQPKLLASWVILAAAAQTALAQQGGNSVVKPKIYSEGFNNHTLILHVSFDPNRADSKSLFVVPAKGDAMILHGDGEETRVANRAGSIIVDNLKNEWFIGKDQKRINLAVASAMLTAPADGGKPILTCPLDTPDAKTVIYGSGDTTVGRGAGARGARGAAATTAPASNPGGILQTRGQSRVGNGVTGVPFYWSSAGYSVLALGEDDNAPASWSRNEAGQIVWTVPGKSIDFYITPTDSLQQACEDYAELTGKPPVPPRWAMGYMQSRWGWVDRAYIEDAVKQFTDRKLPVDAFIFDFEWYTPQPDYSIPADGTADFADFSWNSKLFNEPEKQIADLHSRGIYYVGIRKPRLGNAQLLADFREKKWIVPATATGRGAAGMGSSEQRLLDFSKPEVRDWYAQQTVPLLKAGVDGWWNDEGEQTYTTYTNWNIAQAKAMEQVNPNGRLWTINRAFQPGMQRYGAAAWTGDIQSNWQALADTPTRLLNWSLAGMYYGSCDIGGFMGENSPELLTRWMEAGVFFPVMRSHSSNRVQPRFPWLYGEQAEASIRKALELRYRLVPYYYSLAHEASEKGTPLMRPLAMAYPDDPQVSNLTSQWLMGPGLMPAPILAQANARSVYFPKGTWYIFDSNKTQPGGATVEVTANLDQIPVYVRAGSILTLGPVLQHTDNLPGGPLDLQIYPGANAAFTLAEDDGKTTAYKTGRERHVIFSWDEASRTLSWKTEGAYRGKDIFKEIKATVFDPQGVLTKNVALEDSGKLSFNK